MANEDGPRGRGVLPSQWGAPRQPGRRARLIGKAAVCAGLALYSWVAAGTTPFSDKAFLGVLFPGLVLGAIAFEWPPERIPPPERLDVAGFSYWAICIAAIFEWEASAFKDNSEPWHPALTTLIDPLLQPHPVRCAAMFVWLIAGWGLVRR